MPPRIIEPGKTPVQVQFHPGANKTPVQITMGNPQTGIQVMVTGGETVLESNAVAILCAIISNPHSMDEAAADEERIIRAIQLAEKIHIRSNDRAQVLAEGEQSTANNKPQSDLP